MSDEKCLLQSRWKACCCNCKNRMRLIQNESPFLQVGWACNLAHEYGEQVVHVGDFEHGVCECHDPLQLTPRALDTATPSDNEAALRK